MPTALVLSAFVLAVVAAARSTWSPCGLSMLSTLTPLGERGRGHRFAHTAAWYLAGAVGGGATLGAAMAVAAWGVRAAAPSHAVLLAVGALVAAAGAAADLGLLGVALPVLRRQVNERWLDRYRPWVYGAGFGWQIGVGFATYVMTAAIGVVVVLAALAASPGAAFAAGVVFGTARGLTILANARVTSPPTLVGAHRRYAAWRRPVWATAVAGQAIVAAGLAAAVWPPALAVVVAASATVVVVFGPGRLAVRAGEAPA